MTFWNLDLCSSSNRSSNVEVSGNEFDCSITTEVIKLKDDPEFSDNTLPCSVPSSAYGTLLALHLPDMHENEVSGVNMVSIYRAGGQDNEVVNNMLDVMSRYI